MALKKGKFLTIGILGAITIASFTVWLIPENNQMILKISDFDSHLNGVKEIQKAIDSNLKEEFQKLVDRKINPEEYIETAETSSKQINSQIVELIKTQPPKEWEESYISFIQALKHFNSYIRETIVASKLIEKGETGIEVDDSIQKANQLREEALKLIEESDSKRP